MVYRKRFFKIYSLKFYDIWQNFYFYHILDNENFKMEVEQRNFVTHLIITIQLYYWLSKSPFVKIWSNKFQMVMIGYSKLWASETKKWNFKVVFNRSCCHGNYENVKFYRSIKIFHQYIFHLPSFSLWAATFLLPWFGKWHTLTNCQNCVQPP